VCSAAYFVDCNQAMMLLLQFARDASRELALVMMFSVMMDRKNMFLCHAALSERSRFNLHKRLGALYMMNRTDPSGKYFFDLSKGDDQRALRMLLQLKKSDPNSFFDEVRYAEQCDSIMLDMEPGTESWATLFAENPNGMSFARVYVCAYVRVRESRHASNIICMRRFVLMS